nr:DUF692 family multinuclear iron-containing protein [Pseudenhygromyxa sp. WMMC2535]
MLDAVEICPDHYLRNPTNAAYLRAVLDTLGVPYSFHFTEMSLASPDFLARYDLEAAAAAMRDFEPALVSEHLSASCVGSFRYDGNLPPVHDAPSLARTVAHIDRVSAALGGRELLVENIPCQFEHAASTMTPEAFTLAAVANSGCGLLLDLHNLHVHERNRGLDAAAFLAEIPPACVRELHLAGGQRFVPSGEYIDGHDASLPGRVLELLELALARFDPAFVVIEREANFDDHEGMRRDLEAVRERIG